MRVRNFAYRKKEMIETEQRSFVRLVQKLKVAQGKIRPAQATGRFVLFMSGVLISVCLSFLFL